MFSFALNICNGCDLPLNVFSPLNLSLYKRNWNITLLKIISHVGSINYIHYLFKIFIFISSLKAVDIYNMSSLAIFVSLDGVKRWDIGMLSFCHLICWPRIFGFERARRRNIQESTLSHTVELFIFVGTNFRGCSWTFNFLILPRSLYKHYFKYVIRWTFDFVFTYTQEIRLVSHE